MRLHGIHPTVKNLAAVDNGQTTTEHRFLTIHRTLMLIPAW